jgi:hypothetical protein
MPGDDKTAGGLRDAAMTLDLASVRVLGALIEKEMATPDYYPLSLHALLTACNQKSNRDPVMSLSEGEVAAALEALKAARLARGIHGEGRVVKYAHQVYEVLDLGNREAAVLAVLLLRGPQTLGEIRSRTQSLYRFDDLEAVESCLRRLMERPEPLVMRLPRQPGTKESRYAHVLGGPVESPEPAAAAATVAPDRLARLEEAVASLNREVEDLRRELAAFRKQFE